MLLMCGMTLMGCAHGPCKTLGTLFGCTCVSKRAQPEYQDMSVQLPVFESSLTVDAELDGYTLQAIRIAADDFLDPDPGKRPCRDQQTSYRYLAKREGDVIFVRIEFKPENCGRDIGMLDDGVTYAISVDGRILRRALDGSGAGPQARMTLGP